MQGQVINGNSYSAVPGVTVHLLNGSFKPSVDLTTVTDQRGFYVFEDIVAGEGYSIKVYAENGRALGVEIRFNILDQETHKTLPAIDISKGVDATQASQSDDVLVTDRGTSLGANISNEQVRDLPLYNRTFLALSLIQPGVHDVEQGSPLQGAGFSIAGAHPASTDFRLNSLAETDATGVNNVASGNNQAIPFQVNEAIQELRVVYGVPNLSYGQGSGGVIDVVTSQGHLSAKGSWHGSAFGYFNNDALNSGTPISAYSTSGFFKAAAYANNPGATYSTSMGLNDKITINRNAALGDLGYSSYAPQSYNALYNIVNSLSPNCGSGATPLTICSAGAFNSASVLTNQDSHTMPINQAQFGASAGGPFGKSLLLFASYEGTRINNPTPIFERVPTSLDAIGSSAATDSADSSIAGGILGLFPKPNVGYGTQAASNTGVLGFYRGTAPNYTHVHNLHIRPDIPLTRFGNLGTLSLRYTAQLIDQLHDDTLPASSVYAGNGADRRAQNQSASITHNFTIKNHVNLLSLGFTQFRVDEVAQDRNFNGSLIGLPSGALSSFVISGIDTEATGAAPGTPGYMGGWYDSFWNACGADSATVPCTLNHEAGLLDNTSQYSPSPITPSLDGVFPLARIGAPLSAPSAHRDTEGFLSDSLGFHLSSKDSLTVGGEYRHRQNFSYEGGLARGLVISNNIGEFTHDSETCISCLNGGAFTHPSFDYELRQPTGYTGDLRSTSFGLFAENKFQATPRLTLSAGLRYDYFGQPFDTQNRLWNYSPGNEGLVREGGTKTYDAFDYQCNGAGQSTQTSIDSYYIANRVTFQTGWNCSNSYRFHLPDAMTNLTGRAGFAYSLTSDNRTVFRGAVGGYYQNLPASYTQKLLLNRPSPFNINNPSAIYGQNFHSTGCSASETQCAFGLHTLNFVSLQSGSQDQANFDIYQAASGANILYERDAARLQTPYSIQFSGSVQHQFNKKWIAEAAYVGSVSQRLPAIYDSNFTNEFYCTEGGGSSTDPGGACNNNTFFPVFTESHIGASNYHSAIVRVTSQQWHGLSMHAAFTYAKSLDDVAGTDFPSSTDALWSQLFARQLFGMGNPVAFALGANGLSAGNQEGLRGRQISYQANTRNLVQGGHIPSFSAIESALTTTGSRAVSVSQYNLPQNPLNFTSSSNGGDYGRSDFDVRSRAVGDFIYKMPTFGHKLLNGFLLSSIVTAQTGQPFTIFSGPAYGQITQRINRDNYIKTTGNPNQYIGPRGGIPSLNLLGDLPSSSRSANCPNLFAKGIPYNNSPTPPQVCTGDSGRNAWTGPAYISQDLALQKLTRGFRDSQSFLVRVEFFNLFNRANYDNPISEVSEDGTHLNPEFGLVRSSHDPREIQFAVRYSF